ncbi:MAG TPA: PEP-CTERM sorting domain-containing protein [Gemmata sp.]|nr:PEP-CTERM sorting domain-containing protein [Gemmata sp.]
MIRRNWIARVFAAALVAVAVAAPARAGLLPVSVSIQPEAGNFRWTYSVVLPTDMKLQAGNYFTIYDFGSYVAGSASVSSPFPDSTAASFWTVSTSNSGPTPDKLNPGDDPNVANLTWTYNGPSIDSGKVTLGNFSAVSQFDQTQNSFFTATNPRSADGVIDSNITETITPIGSNGPGSPPGVPEPATLALAGLGLPLIGVARWVRRTKK